MLFRALGEIFKNRFFGTTFGFLEQLPATAFEYSDRKKSYSPVHFLSTLEKTITSFFKLFFEGSCR